MIEKGRNVLLINLFKTIFYWAIAFKFYVNNKYFNIGNFISISGNGIYVFDFIKKILHDEFHEINVENDSTMVREKKTKLRKRQITMSVDYYNTHICA